jgi:pyruvate dehydrogenase E2 component (dihydrolipoamide acetyltransferase)
MPVEILMPALDPSMSEARLVKWLKAEGDPVSIGEPIVEIETDKAVVEIEAEVKGTFGKALVKEGCDAAVNAVIGLIMTESEEITCLNSSASAVQVKAPFNHEAADVAEATIPPPKKSACDDGNRIFVSPLARRMAVRSGLDLSKISGSGPNGRIIKCDIERVLAIKDDKSTAMPQRNIEPRSDDFAYLPSYQAVRNSSLRSAIARRLTESSQFIPHYFLSIDCELDKALEMRKELNSACSIDDKLSLNDIIVRAAAIALQKVPDVNVVWTEEAILHFAQVDISVAVAIKGGLITPVIRNAGGKGLAQISREVKNLAAKATEGKLLPEEYKGGTFTISNLGMFGIKSFTSIINPPQGAILSIGAGEQRPVVKDGKLGIANVMSVTLAADHRCIDGAVGAEFMGVFKSLIEMPVAMLL